MNYFLRFLKSRDLNKNYPNWIYEPFKNDKAVYYDALELMDLVEVSEDDK